MPLNKILQTLGNLYLICQQLGQLRCVCPAPAAKRQIKKLTKAIQKLIVERLEELAVEPRPSGILKMEGEESFYRVRVGDYRIIYEIQDRALLIVVVKVGHRGGVYR